jgi:hypothetical protein
MAFWLHHRQRQAGKYAKRQYKLEIAQLNAPAQAQARAAKAERKRLARERRASVSLDNQIKAVFAPRVPERPDLPLGRVEAR